MTVYDDPPPSDQDLEASRNAETMRRNAERELWNLRKKNRKAGIPEPKPGDILHVQVARGLNRRSRAGVTFGKGPSVPVEVIDASDEDVLELLRTGKTVVNPNGAERILDDDSLIVRQQSFGSVEDMAEAMARIDALELENKALREQAAATKVDREARQAQMDAGDTRVTRPASSKPAAGKPPATKPASAASDKPPDGGLFDEPKR